MFSSEMAMFLGLAVTMVTFQLSLSQEGGAAGEGQPVEWKFINMPETMDKLMDLPDVRNESRQIKLDNRFRTIRSGRQLIWIYVRHGGPEGFLNGSVSKQDVLFFHGASYSSQTWQDLGTLNLLSALGFEVYAVDLPGFGWSAPATIPDQAHFVRDMIAELQLNRPVIVCPSMSGRFVMPYVLGDEVPNISGFVPIAPTFTSGFPISKYEGLQVPTMILYGENDVGVGWSSLHDLIHFPNKRVFMVEKAGHAPHTVQRTVFHKLMYNFLMDLTSN